MTQSKNVVWSSRILNKGNWVTKKNYFLKKLNALNNREIEIQKTLRFQFIPIRITRIQNSIEGHGGDYVDKKEHSSIASGIANRNN